MRVRYWWIAGIFFILFSIFLLWKFLPAGGLKNSRPASPESRPVDRKSRDITLESVYPGYRLEKTAQFSRYEDFLESLDFWGEGAIVDPGGTQTAQSLRIVLTAFFKYPILREGYRQIHTMTAFGGPLDKGALRVFIFLDPDAVRSANFEPESVFSAAMLHAANLLSENDQSIILREKVATSFLI